jgi:hypothetical protein
MNETTFYRSLTDLTGKGAIIARGIVEHFLTGETKLRKCQEAAAELADELGVAVATSTISVIARLLRDAEVFHQLDPKEKRKGYFLYPDRRLEEFAEFLDGNIDYGTRIKGSHAEDMQRLNLIQHLEEHGAVRANNITNKIPSKAYKLLAEKMMRGELDVIYVPAGTVVGVKHDGETKRVSYYVD